MPLLDLPLEQLRSYDGRNPKPADFDQVWDAGLAELDALDFSVELSPHALKCRNAECFDLFFTGVGGARVYAKYLRPKNVSTPVPCVLQFHGYSANSGDWSDKLSYVANGFAVAALDCRGQGGKSEDVGGVRGNTHSGHIIRGLEDALDGQPEKLLFRSIFLDTAQLARVVSAFPEVDENRLGAMGGSQGGGLTLACAALHPNIKRVASQFPFLCDYQRVWEMDQAQNAYAELKTWFRHFDPRHEREEEVWNALGYIDVQHLMPRVRADVQMAVGLSDPVCPPSTQFAAFNKISSAKETVIYPDFGHEGFPGWSDRVYNFLSDL